MSAWNLEMTKFYSDNAPDPVGNYPHARRVGELLFLSGVGPRTPETNLIPGNIYGPDDVLTKYDIALQCHSVIKNVDEILKSSGGGMENLVDITVFLTNMKDDFKIFNEIYGEYFRDHQPCRTTVEVLSLPTDIAIELKCIAHFT